MAEVVVVGGGIGGLCAALRLGVAGHHVTLLERRVRARGQGGGRASATASGSTPVPRSSRSRTCSTRCSASSGCGWPTTSTSCASTRRSATTGPTAAPSTSPTSPATTRVAFDRFSAGAGAAWQGWDRRGERIWAIARRTFLAGSMDAPRAVAAPPAAAERPVGHRRSPIAGPGRPPHLRRRPAGAVGRPVRHLQRLVALRRARHAGLHLPHRVGLRGLVPARGHGHADGRPGGRGGSGRRDDAAGGRRGEGETRRRAR